ncbi:MAG TPA: carboxypeptidase-like regulatory domain-containing protein [Rhodothermales bacterium]|nr:carboxypeptidase-like regulatory domain-containing protein [Rhodothermales bacterium]
MRRIRILALFGALVILEALAGTAYAQTAKLSGKITDAATGETLPGATVQLVGTTLGATADIEGDYVVVGITPGTYTIRFSYIGYATQNIEMRLVSDRTTELNVRLRAEDQQQEELVVESQRVVDQNQTASRALVTGEELTRLPVTTLQDAISRTANSYEGFIRGSRRYETRTILEGIDVSDALNPIAPNSLGAAYVGLTYNNVNRSDQTNSSLVTLNPEGIEEVTVNTGATEARYGAASGGVVAVTLAEGRGPIRGTFSFRTAPSIPQPGPDSLEFYSQTDIDAYNAEKAAKTAANNPAASLFTWTPDRYTTGGEPEIDARLSLGGSILRNWTFTGTGQFFQTHGFQPNQFSKRMNGQLKTSYSVTPRTKVTAVGIVEDRGLWGNWNNTSYNDFWRFNLESVAQHDGGSFVGSLRLTQLLSQKTFFEVQAYRTYQRNRYGYPDDDGNGFTDPGENGEFIDLTDPATADKYVGRGADRTKMFYENISDSYSDTGIFLPNGTRYKAGRPSPYQEDATQVTNGYKFDLNSQVTDNHYLQTGVELKLRRFDYNQVQGWDQSGSKLAGTLEPFAVQNWTRRPTEFGAYIADRMEWSGLIVNLGLRVEAIDRNMREIVDYYHPFRRDTVAINYTDANGAAQVRRVPRNNFVRGEKVPVDVFLNPRIGVSHPIGTNGSMYFSYARSRQLVPYTTLYSMYDANNSNNVSVVYQDPTQEPITSNSYELGVQWEFSEGWGADVNAYMRSVDNYGQAVFSTQNRNLTGQTTLVGASHLWATSAGYADVRGIELVLRRRPLRLTQNFTLGLTGSYTYSSVEVSNFAGANRTGFADATNGAVVTIPFENSDEFKNFPQNVRGGASVLTGGYDRTHRVLLRSVATIPFGINLGINASAESGFLYPPVVNVDPRDRELLTGPANYRIDARIEKRFAFTPRFGLDLYADVTNLTNRQNVVAYENFTPNGPAVFQTTGSPGQRLILQDGTALYGPARTVYFGTRLRF